MRALCYASLLAVLTAAPTLQAQTVLDVRSTCDTNAPGLGCNTVARSVFRVDDSGSFVAPIQIGIGAIPATGAGDRLMWHAYKAAFRAGGVDGAQWDESNSGFYSTALGFNAVALGNYSFAAGYGARSLLSYGTASGYLALAKGTGAVSLGYRTTADADYSVAIGQRASTNGFTGAFVIADASTTDSLEAASNNQFSARYAGGYRLYTNATRTTGLTMAAGGSSWNVVSDRSRKEDFIALDGEAVLGAVAQLPLSTWHYRDTETTDRHVGPMAQDWHRLISAPLALNGDSLTINQGDFDGVNLAGIQALEARTRRLDEENRGLQAQVEALQAELAALRAERTADAARFARVEAVLARLVASETPETTLATAAPGAEPQP